MSALTRQLSRLATNPTVQRTVREGVARLQQAAARPENRQRIAELKQKLTGPSGPGRKRY